MKKETTLAKKLTGADGKAKLDHVCKTLIAHKEILAWILKSCTEEFQDVPIDDIVDKYIEGTPIVAVEAVHQDEPGVQKAKDEPGKYVSGMANEEPSQTEGTITFDIRFEAVAPDDGRVISLIINIEVQADFYPGYPLTKRAIYYVCRMISAQYGKTFEKSHYEKIKKVYSIWICVDPPNNRKNTITTYEMTEKNIVGNVTESKENYDLMTVVMVCLGDPEKAEYQSVLKMLDVLLSTETKPEEKKKTLSEEFHIAMTEKIESEVLEMGGYGDWVEKKITERVTKRLTEQVTQQVTESVTQQVTESSKKENTFRNICSLMKTTGWTVEETMNRLDIPQEEQSQYLEMLETELAPN
jgi:hypothetical protein